MGDLDLVMTQDKSEYDYLESKKKYENEKNSINLNKLYKAYNTYRDYTNNYIDYINNNNLAELNKSTIKLLNDDLNKEEEYILQQEDQRGGKRISKANSKKVAKKPVVSQKKQSECKEILGKKMKIYKMPDSRKEYVKYKGELHHIADYKNLMKQKANAKQKAKTKPKK